MKRYKIYIITSKIRYPANENFSSDSEYIAYLNLLINKRNTAILNEGNDFDKLHNFFNQIKTPLKTITGNVIETNVYRLVQCIYEKNKLKEYQIMYSKYPELNSIPIQRIYEQRST